MKKVICFDIGGTKINLGIVNEKGEIEYKEKIMTHFNDGEQNIEAVLRQAIDRFMVSDIVGIGIASAGFIDVKNKKVIWSGNIASWTGFDFNKFIGQAYPNVSLVIENDANAAGICEGWLGAAKDSKSYIMLTIGTGLGGAIFDDERKLLYGNRYHGGELGHMILRPNGRLCTCGQKGCAETYISGTGIKNNYLDITGKIKDSISIMNDVENDLSSKEAIAYFAENLAIFLTSLTNCFDPETFVIGGGVIESKDKWWDLLIERYMEYTHMPIKEIRPAVYNNDSGIIGVAKKVFDERNRHA